MRGAESTLDPVVLASFMMAAFDGLMVQWVADPERPSPREELLGSFEAAMGLAAPDRRRASRAARRSPRRRRSAAPSPASARSCSSSALNSRAAASDSSAQKVSASWGSATSPDMSRLSTTSSARSDSSGSASSRYSRYWSFLASMNSRSNGPSRRGNRLAGVALDDLHAIAHAGVVEEPARRGRAGRVDLERHEPAVLERLRHVQRRVADRGAHLEHARVAWPGTAWRGSARLPVDDRHGVALGQHLHLGHHRDRGPGAASAGRRSTCSWRIATRSRLQPQPHQQIARAGVLAGRKARRPRTAPARAGWRRSRRAPPARSRAPGRARRRRPPAPGRGRRRGRRRTRRGPPASSRRRRARGRSGSAAGTRPPAARPPAAPRAGTRSAGPRSAARPRRAGSRRRAGRGPSSRGTRRAGRPPSRPPPASLATPRATGRTLSAGSLGPSFRGESKEAACPRLLRFSRVSRA